ncbi:MAG: alpha-glucan family phosphorylase, partial [Deltaproteobacteria bacterium]|nr:alpha-glucan family phosphorylase [Deltaproteobacteria bacterium]
LGILSGDHLKSASDLKLPIVGVSLAYQKGYFRQYLTHEGWQSETYPVNDFSIMPMSLLRDKNQLPVKVSVLLKEEEVWIQVWEVKVGRIRLLLLDTNIPDNSPHAREITAELYGGDRDMRIRQEIVLGIGGVRMLKALGLSPEIYHMNEGHSAFAVLERIRGLKEDKGLKFNEALEFVRSTNVFTTHTPVPAGNDMFHPDLVRAYFTTFARLLGITIDVLMGYGRQDPKNRDEEFCMTVLALRLSNCNNGVSRLHASVSRKMWKNLWPKTMEVDFPIGHVTNGVHIPSWISKGMAENYARYLGPLWIEDPDNVVIWERVKKIPDTELWRTHERGRERLVSFARERLKKQLLKRGVNRREIDRAEEVLNSEILTIGFARRFAPYKRVYLILKDLQRLETILKKKDSPVQIIFAGKAHPQDQMGKDLIKYLVEICGREDLRRNMVFLEDYDMEVARYMVQGADVWLNTPRRPLEACGTSGMKAVANGALHFSVLDGWWDEGYDPEIGWSIGNGEEYSDPEYQDDIESRGLYDTLEKEIVPIFYERGSDGMPRRWLAMMKASLHKLGPTFNTHRMVTEYWDRYYVPSAERGLKYIENGYEKLKQISRWRDEIMYNWSKISIKDIRMDKISEIEIGASYHLEADISLEDLSVDDVFVEVYYGRLDPLNLFKDSNTKLMYHIEDMGNSVHRYECDINFQEVGNFGLNIRITPNHPYAESRHAMGLAIWGKV